MQYLGSILRLLIMQPMCTMKHQQKKIAQI